MTAQPDVTAEPTPIRDNGPYRSAQQARAQFDAVTHGLPAPSDLSDDETTAAANRGMVLVEALLMTGVRLADWERETWVRIARQIEDPAEVQLIAGSLIRAHLAGRERGSA